MTFESSTEATQHHFGLQLLASTLAHEIRNPLQAMRLQVEMAQRQGATSQSLEQISDNLDRVERVVEKVQRLNQNYQLEPKRISLSELLHSVMSSVRFWISAAGIRIEEWSDWQGDPEVEIDSDLMEQVLLNIVRNAIHAMPHGGLLKVGLQDKGDEAAIIVEDTGYGMNKETLNRVGTPFFTTKKEGNGLGVSFCKSILALHHGSIQFESAEGCGTKVNVQFPKQIFREEAACSQQAEF